MTVLFKILCRFTAKSLQCPLNGMNVLYGLQLPLFDSYGVLVCANEVSSITLKQETDERSKCKGDSQDTMNI